MSQIKPFELPWTAVHNCVFDEIMPTLSPNGWKVLCVAIRQTLGWIGNGPGGRKESDRISYSQFKEKTGIGSYSTVSRAIKECLDRGFLLRTQVSQPKGARKPDYAYSLNLEYVVEVTTETVVGATTVSVVGATTETVDTKAKETNRKEENDDGDLQELVASMISIGVHEGQARKWAKRRPSDMIRGWIQHLRGNGRRLSNPAGFLVAKLRDGERPPSAKRLPSGDRRRYLAEGSPYAASILH